MARKPKTSQNVFEQNQSIDFAVFSAEFRQGLRALSLYVNKHAGIPSPTVKDVTGFPLGQWVRGHQEDPHSLSIPERAVLLAIPGMKLTTMVLGPEPVEVVKDPAREYLWQRLSRWSQDPMLDPVHARRVAGTTPRQEVAR